MSGYPTPFFAPAVSAVPLGPNGLPLVNPYLPPVTQTVQSSSSQPSKKAKGNPPQPLAPPVSAVVVSPIVAANENEIVPSHLRRRPTKDHVKAVAARLRDAQSSKRFFLLRMITHVIICAAMPFDHDMISVPSLDEINSDRYGRRVGNFGVLSEMLRFDVFVVSRRPLTNHPNDKKMLPYLCVADFAHKSVPSQPLFFLYPYLSTANRMVVDASIRKESAGASWMDAINSAFCRAEMLMRLPNLVADDVLPDIDHAIREGFVARVNEGKEVDYVVFSRGTVREPKMDYVYCLTGEDRG